MIFGRDVEAQQGACSLWEVKYARLPVARTGVSPLPLKTSDEHKITSWTTKNVP
jgi:hypothetical protein